MKMFSCLLSSHFCKSIWWYAIIRKWNFSFSNAYCKGKSNMQPSQNDFHFGSFLFFLTIHPNSNLWIPIHLRNKSTPRRFCYDQVVTTERWMLFELECRCGVTIPAYNSEKVEVEGILPTFKTEEGEWQAQVNQSISELI